MSKVSRSDLFNFVTLLHLCFCYYFFVVTDINLTKLTSPINTNLQTGLSIHFVPPLLNTTNPSSLRVGIHHRPMQNNYAPMLKELLHVPHHHPLFKNIVIALDRAEIVTSSNVDQCIRDFICMANNAYSLYDEVHGEEAACRWAEGFEWPSDIRTRDTELLSAYDNSLERLTEHHHQAMSSQRLSPERVIEWVDPSDPDYQRILDLAEVGMRVFTHASFQPNGKPQQLRTRYIKKVRPAVNKIVHKSWSNGLVFIIPRSIADNLQPPLHYSPMHWTTNAGKPQGRMLIDSSDNSGNGHALNTEEARVQLENYYGTIEHPTLHTIVELIVKFRNNLPQEHWNEMVLFKGDLKGAFTLLNVKATDTARFASLLSDELVLLYPTGSFGWTGTPYCFQVITRVLTRLLQVRVKGTVWAYVDDIMGICLKQDLEHNIAVIRDVCTGLLGPDAIAEDKWAWGRRLDLIGWDIDLEHWHVSISRKNCTKLIYGFFAMDITLEIMIDLLKRLAAWASRYTTVLRQAAPLTSVLYGQLTGHTTSAPSCKLNKATITTIQLWRILICMMELHPDKYTRTLDSFIPNTKHWGNIHFDASLTGLGVFITNDDGHVVAAAQVDIDHLNLKGNPKYQNTVEFMALTVGIIMLCNRGITNVSVKAIGDSVTSLKWAKRERFQGIRCTAVAMVYISLCTRYNITVGETEHIAGLHNTICDDLSRNVRSVAEVFPGITDEMELTPQIINTLLRAADPSWTLTGDQDFSTLWNYIHSIIKELP